MISGADFITMLQNHLESRCIIWVEAARMKLAQTDLDYPVGPWGHFHGFKCFYQNRMFKALHIYFNEQLLPGKTIAQ